MEKRYINILGVQNVAASKTALIELPIGLRYHQIYLEHGFASGTNTVAGAAANITQIRILINGTVVRRFSGTQLLDLLLFNGTQFNWLGVPNTAPGCAIPILFAEPFRNLPIDRDALALKTNLFRSLRIEVDFGAASTPTLVCSAVVDDMQATGPELVVHILDQPYAATGTSFVIPSIEREGRLVAVHIYPDSGASLAPSRVTLLRNQKILSEMTFSANKIFLTTNGMTPAALGRTANMYDLVADHDDLLSSDWVLDGANDLNLKIEAASAMSGSTTYLTEILKFPK